MDTVDYSQHLMRVGKTLMRLAEDVESAADGELAGEERDAAIAAGRARLADYDGVVSQLEQSSKVLQAQFVKRLEDDIGLLRESLARIDAGE